MQKKHWIAPGIVAITLVASSLALSSSKPAVAREKQDCCKKMQKKLKEKLNRNFWVKHFHSENRKFFCCTAQFPMKK